MSKEIFNTRIDESFTVGAVGLQVGPPGSDHIQVGDKVYMVLTLNNFHAGTRTMTDPEWAEFLGPFFTFRTETNNKNLAVTPLRAKLTSPSGGAAAVLELTYVANFTDRETGEESVNVFARFLDTSTTHGARPTTLPEIKLLDISSPSRIYIHQSMASKLQTNFVTDGGLSDDAGLDRDNLGFPFFPIGLQPVNPKKTRDISLWTVIRNGTNALSFKRYSDFMDFLFCGGPNPFSTGDEQKFRTKLKEINAQRSLPFNNVDAYRALKVATEAFVMGSIEVFGVPDNSFQDLYDDYLKAVNTKTGSTETVRVLPYLALIRQKLSDIDFKKLPFEKTFLDYLDDSLKDRRALETCYGLVSAKLQFPCFIELIWSYWHEESMMVQGISTIARRFQNIRGEGAVDPLANLEIGPLRPLNNLMWGYIQDEQHRLTVRRRAYEYDHHYGISLQGTAVQNMRPADSRSKFIEAFHTLLNLCVKFYHQYDDTTVVADGFPIMNALKEVHMILSEGAHNQFGDLPSTARIEMLMQQYILARPEFREFLPTRQSVAYPEPWMDRVAVLNQLHGWTKANVLHFRDLAMFGEQIVLSVRYGAWSDVFNRDQAANWAIFWRPQIQNYLHAYRAVTGVDLSREDGNVDAKQPSYHLVRRMAVQNSNGNGKMIRS